MKSHESAPEQRKQPNYKLRKAIAGTVVAGLLGTGAYKGMDYLNDREQAHFDRIEQEALGEVENAWSSVVVLSGGANVRTSPHLVNNDPEQGTDTNAFTVQDGSVLVITSPVVYRAPSMTNENEDTWLGFTIPDTKSGNTVQNSQEVYWVNYTELNRQSSDQRNYVDVWELPANADTPLYQVHGHDSSGFYGGFGEGNRKGGPIAYASTMPEQAFTNQYVPDTGLEPSRIR
jgi:hypothetical protein